MSYLHDNVDLKLGSVDEVGATNSTRNANAPGDYVFQLQTDLTAFGFALGRPDGLFGGQTRDALVDLQVAAMTSSRFLAGATIQVPITYPGGVHGTCDQATRSEIRRWKEGLYRAAPTSPPRWIGPSAPQAVANIPFAPIGTGTRFWPILTRAAQGREVAFQGVDGNHYGRRGRAFLADRDQRYHVGVDLFGSEGDLVVACEDGQVISIYHFYKNTFAFFVRCDSGLVVNYGEIAKDSWLEFGLDIGKRVSAGKPIARVGKMDTSSMCHFETYKDGTTSNKRYMKGQAAPGELYNPSAYLLDLAANGL